MWSNNILGPRKHGAVCRWTWVVCDSLPITSWECRFAAVCPVMVSEIWLCCLLCRSPKDLECLLGTCPQIDVCPQATCKICFQGNRNTIESFMWEVMLKSCWNNTCICFSLWKTFLHYLEADRKKVVTVDLQIALLELMWSISKDQRFLDENLFQHVYSSL